jgi:hypothetical protein
MRSNSQGTISDAQLIKARSQYHPLYGKESDTEMMVKGPKSIRGTEGREGRKRIQWKRIQCGNHEWNLKCTGKATSSPITSITTTTTTTITTNPTSPPPFDICTLEGRKCNSQSLNRWNHEKPKHHPHHQKLQSETPVKKPNQTNKKNPKIKPQNHHHPITINI